MSNKSKIEWTDVTWNPIRGCSIVSKGCTNCYAMKQAHRSSGKGGAYEGLTKLTNGGPVWTGKIKLVHELLDRPLHWKKPRRVFVNSMSDLFHEDVPDEFIASVFAVMRDARSHTFQILTKRPNRAFDLLNDPEFYEYVEERSSVHETETMFSIYKKMEQFVPPKPPYPNVWLGVSIEDQQTADERIPLLLQTPAAVRWISAEPLLGPIDLTNIQLPEEPADQILKTINAPSVLDVLNKTVVGNIGLEHNIKHGVAWVVTGGESGPGARPSHPDWFQSLRDQCVAADIPFFFKQWGEWVPTDQIGKGIEYSADADHLHLFDDDTFPAVRIGKKKAGRAIDGQIWDQYPT